MLDKLTIDDFSSHLNRTFRISLPHAGEDTAEAVRLEAELVEVTRLPARKDEEDKRAPFSVIFRGPREPVLPQQIYALESDRLETVELFLVPLGPDRNGMLYEAIFT